LVGKRKFGTIDTLSVAVMPLIGQCAEEKIEHLLSSDNYRRTEKTKKRVRRVHRDSNSSEDMEGRQNSNEKPSSTREDVEDMSLSDLKGTTSSLATCSIVFTG